MTMWGKFCRTRARLTVQTERWETPDGDDLTMVRTEGDDASPIVLLLHGLEGSIRSHYVGAILAESVRRGWTGILLHFRTCDGRLNRARRTYHSGETSDLDFVVHRLLAAYPARPIGLAGISLGANVMLKWLGEHPERVDPRIAAAVAVSTPFDLTRSSERINSGFSRLYQWNFVRKLRRKALAKLRDYPDIAAADPIAAATTIRQFDDRFTAPLHGFRDAADYYERSSSLRLLHRIRTRTLLLSARDDPFHPAEVLDEVMTIAAMNPCLELEFHERGGHVGFVEGPPWRPRYYLEWRVLDFLSRALQSPTA